MIKLNQEIKNNKLLIVSVSGENYNEGIIRVTKQLSQNEKVCYVSLSQPHSILCEKFKVKNIDTENLVFIDAVTKDGKKSVKNVIFINSPNSLTELSVNINKVLEGMEIKNLVFDSLSTMLIYESSSTVSMFIHRLTAKLRSLNVHGIFIILKDDMSPELSNNLHMFTDVVLDLG